MKSVDTEEEKVNKARRKEKREKVFKGIGKGLLFTAAIAGAALAGAAAASAN